MRTDEKIAVGVALAVVAALFMTFLPAFRANAVLPETAESPSLEISVTQ